MSEEMNENENVNLNEEPKNEFHQEEPHYAPPQGTAQVKDDGTTGKTVVALILGITAVVLSCSVVMGLFGLGAGIVGLIFAIKERKEHPSGMATAAFVLSIIGLILGVLSTVACVACTCFLGVASSSGYLNDSNWLYMFQNMGNGVYY